MDKNLVLIGMMGSGKSTLGRILSNKIKLEFYDVDKIIENESGYKIKEIFDKKGEEFFRNLEEKTSIKLLRSSNSIIALGGGAFINKNIRDELKLQSVSIWLKWSHKFLLPRIINNKNRPMVKNLNEKELIKLTENRYKIYSKADYKINCDKLDKQKIVEKIIYIYKNEKNNSKYKK